MWEGVMRAQEWIPVECEACGHRWEVLKGIKYAFHYKCSQKRRGQGLPLYRPIEEQPES